jgi:hypothetical protein
MAVEGLRIRRASALGGSIPPPGTNVQSICKDPVDRPTDAPQGDPVMQRAKKLPSRSKLAVCPDLAERAHRPSIIPYVTGAYLASINCLRQPRASFS